MAIQIFKKHKNIAPLSQESKTGYLRNIENFMSTYQIINN